MKAAPVSGDRSAAARVREKLRLFTSRALFWRSFLRRLSPPGHSRQCPHRPALWSRMRRNHATVCLEETDYCLENCLEPALTRALERASQIQKPAASPHRIPLGLLLLSRQQLTIFQHRAALEAQRQAGHGRIGEWLQQLGFATELQVAAALARQWACPLLRRETIPAFGDPMPRIPVALLRALFIAPIGFLSGAATLHIAFGDRPDYGVLHALERMLGCRVDPCVVPSSLLRRHIANWPEGRSPYEAVFERFDDVAEFSRIVCSYARRMHAAEIRLAVCRGHFWVRLLRPQSESVDLVARRPDAALVPQDFPAAHSAPESLCKVRSGNADEIKRDVPALPVRRLSPESQDFPNG